MFVYLLAALVAPAGADAAKPPVAGCADHWQVELDRDSFANNGAGRTFTPAQLASFRSNLGVLLRSAVGEACRKGAVKPALARQVRQVRVFSASGATEPHLYAAGRQVLNLEWVFAEENLAIPSSREIIDGFACWANPRASLCLEPND